MAIMIDIETWSTETYAAIRSIGAVQFDIQLGANAVSSAKLFPEDGSASPLTFYANVLPPHDGDPYGDVSASTMQWWENQGQAAKDAFSSPAQVPLAEALQGFRSWSRAADKSGGIWANDPDFDLVIIKSACNRHGVAYPFQFYTHRSCRTVFDWMRIPKNAHAPLVAHHALHDAISQARKVCDAWEAKA